LTQGGLFESWVGTDEIMVNSLHFQGVEKLGDELEVEAVAEDGTVEGFTVKNAKGFTAAVQWHPEYEPATNKFSKCFYEAFAEAVLTR
jgi:putative glutamine amidotransferase